MEIKGWLQQGENWCVKLRGGWISEGIMMCKLKGGYKRGHYVNILNVNGYLLRNDGVSFM